MSRQLIAFLVAALAGARAALCGSPALADSTREKQWHLDFLKVAEAQRASTGKGVTVAVIDSGVSNHPDLAGSVLNGKDFIKSSGDGRTDLSGHGTSIAGLIAAHGKNGNGALGIAPDAKILPIRVFNQKPRNAEVGPAIDYAVAHGAKVINLSLGGGVDPATLNAVQAARDADVVLVASAGNKPEDVAITAPAFLEEVVAVGAIDRSGRKAAVSVSGTALDLMAPGDDIKSTGTGGRYRTGTGTSDSAAIVSGAAALLRSKYPNMTATEVIERLESTATDAGAPGVDNEYGHGIVNIVAALAGPGAPVPSASAPASTPVAVPSGTATAADPPDSEATSSSVPLVAGGIALAVLVGGLFVFLRRRSANSD